MLIDFHAHTFLDKLAAGAVSSLAERAHFKPNTNGTVSATRAIMREQGVDRFVALNIAVSPHTERHVNDYAISLLQYPEIIPFGSVHPDSPNALSEIDRLYEAGIKDEVMLRREAQLEAVTEDLYKENLTFSPGDRARDKWVERALSGRSESLLALMRKLYSGLELLRYENVMVLNASHGLLLWPLMKKNPEGYSLAVVRSEEQKEIIEHFSSSLDALLRPSVIVSDPCGAFSHLEDGLMFSVISGRNVLSRLESDRKILPLMKSRLEKDGKIALLESVPVLSSRLSDFADGIAADAMREAEKRIYSESNPLTAWREKELEEAVREVFPDAAITYERECEERLLSDEALRSFYRQSYSDCGLTESEFLAAFPRRSVRWSNTVAVIRSGFGEAAGKDKSGEWGEVVRKTRQ